MADHDIVIRGGTIVAVGTVAGTGREEIDATRVIVTPGVVEPPPGTTIRESIEHRVPAFVA